MARKKYEDTALDTGREALSIMNTSAGVKKQRKEPSEDEAAERMEDMRTQGVKGLKQLRMAMAFTPANTQYIQTMSGIQGISMTKFVNMCVERDRKAMGEDYEKAVQFVELMNAAQAKRDEE